VPFEQGPVAEVATNQQEQRPVLSFEQEHLWFHDQLRPGTSADTVVIARRIRGDLDVTSLRRSVAGVVRRHQALRTSYQTWEGVPYQVIDPVGPRLSVADVSASADPAREAHRILAAEVASSFDLVGAPLFRAKLARVSGFDHLLIITAHRSVFDEWSRHVLIRELSLHYAELRKGVRLELEPLPMQYADFAAWQRERLAAERLAGELAYWRDRVESLPPAPNLPADHVCQDPPDPRAGSVSFEVAPNTVERINAFPAGPSAVTAAAFLAVLYRYTGTGDLVVGTPVTGRKRPELAEVIGFFGSVLPLRADLSADPSFAELVSQVRTSAGDAAEHQDLPFEHVVEQLAPARAFGPEPIMRVLFDHSIGERAAALELPGLEVTELDVGTPGTRYDLELRLVPAGGRLTGRAIFPADLFEPATMTRFAEHYTYLLASATDAPSARVSRIPMADDQEVGLAAGWNAEGEGA
jgi:hypothetical protein